MIRQERPPQASEPYVPYRVTEKSCYGTSFTELPMEPLRHPCSPRDMFPTYVNGKETGRSSYADQYQWPAPAYRPKGDRPSDDGRQPPFEGETTYRTMFTPCTAAPAGRTETRFDNSTLRTGGKVKFE